MTKLWDPFAEEYLHNPYPMYDRLREHAPVFQTQSGDYVLTGFKEIKAVLLDSKNFRVGNRYEWIGKQVKYLENKDEDLSGITDAMNSFLVQMNEPEHTIMRKLMVDAWDNHDLEMNIKANIKELLGNMKGEVDLVKEFASPLPVITMAQVMGMPIEDYLKLKDISSRLIFCLDMYTSFKTLVKIDEAARTFIDYINKYLDYREANLSTDLTSKVILLAEARSIKLSRKQLISMCIFLFMAGEETTVNLIGTGTLNLLQNQNALTSLKDNPLLWDKAVEEILRFESPVQLAGRIANTRVALGGISIEKDSTLTLSLGAANRDPSIFNAPDKFDINRSIKSHLAFGAGTHFCIGSWLAKMEWKLAMKELFDRFPKMKLAGKPKWNPMLSIRGLSSLPVIT